MTGEARKSSSLAGGLAAGEIRSALVIWRLLLVSQWREQPIRLALTVLAVGLGVALSAAVFLVNGAALNEFGLAAKRLVGEADIVVRGPREGFPEQLFVELARDPAVSQASPVLDLEVALAGRREALQIIGIDPFRAGALQPALVGDIEGRYLELFQQDSVYLSESAAEHLGLARSSPLEIIVGTAPRTLRVIGVLPRERYGQEFGLMDIASAAWTLERVGRLNRIDLRLRRGVDVAAFRTALARRLPPGVVAVAPEVELNRARTVTRAYRVNLNVLALVTLWTGGFLVFSTQALSVLRRRRSLALLRALGVTRSQLELALTGEGLALGFLGSAFGVGAGAALAGAALDLLAGDLGNGQLRNAGASLGSSPFSAAAFMLMGMVVAALGAWLPARAAARRAPAESLKGGVVASAGAPHRPAAGLALLALGVLLSRLPSIGGLPVAGYASIAALLFGAVLLVPALTTRALALAPTPRRVAIHLGIAQLRENVVLSTLGLSAVIVSFSLMVAMAIMVHSFRTSFDRWLGKLLPADVQLREPYGNDTALWSESDQSRIAAVPGVARAEFRRTRSLLLDPSRPPVALIARGADSAQAAAEIPVIRHAPAPAGAVGAEPAWISEALQDLGGAALGAPLDLTLGGRPRHFYVAGVWRDYARSTGSVVISRAAYRDATGDAGANEGSLWLEPGADPARIESAIHARFPRGDSFEILTSTALRDRSLKIFDRAFAVTYALEAVAVALGLVGVAFAAGSTALARRAEFGMLRHIGLLRRQILALLATEGVLTSAFGVLYGLALGMVLSLVLVYVINRQSFNWSIDLAVPAAELAALSITLIAAAALTAVAGGRAATSRDAVQAVREDW